MHLTSGHFRRGPLLQSGLGLKSGAVNTELNFCTAIDSICALLFLSPEWPGCALTTIGGYAVTQAIFPNQRQSCEPISSSATSSHMEGPILCGTRRSRSIPCLLLSRAFLSPERCQHISGSNPTLVRRDAAAMPRHPKVRCHAYTEIWESLWYGIWGYHLTPRTGWCFFVSAKVLDSVDGVEAVVNELPRQADEAGR